MSRRGVLIPSTRVPRGPHPDDAYWVKRIEAIRLEEAPAFCDACGSRTPERPSERWCPRCERWRPIEQFGTRSNRRKGWFRAHCRSCESRLTQLRALRRAS